MNKQLAVPLLTFPREAVTWAAIMSRYLRHFTAVGDEQPAQWDDEEELNAASEELSAATGQFPTTLTFRESLQRLYGSDRFQVYHTCLSLTVCCNSFFDVLSLLKPEKKKRQKMTNRGPPWVS